MAFTHESDIYTRDGVISYGQCQRLLSALSEYDSPQMIPKNSTESKQLYNVFQNAIELYLQDGGYVVYPSITMDTGYMYYRFCDANSTKLSVPGAGTHVQAILFLS